MQDELLARQSAAQLGLESVALDGLEIHFRFEELEIVVAIFLGMVNGGVGIFDERFGVFTFARVDTDTDAAFDMEIMPGNGVWGGEGKNNLTGTGGGVSGMSLGEQDDEFIAALAADGIGSADARQEPLRNGLQQLVTNGVAEGIVDVFEAVEIREEYGEIFFLAAGQRNGLGDAVVEEQAIGKIGDHVVLRGVGHLRGHGARRGDVIKERIDVPGAGTEWSEIVGW
jgi:hypothetical protein